MENLVMEMIERYIVYGCIAYAALFTVMFTRIIWFTVKGVSNMSEVAIRSRRENEWAEEIKGRPKASRGEMLLRYAVWPYGIIKISNIYFGKEEQKLIRKLNGRQ